MEDELDLVFGEHAFEEGPVENRAGDLAIDLWRDRRIEAGEIERHDSAPRVSSELLDQPVANLAAGSGNQHNGLAHDRKLY